MLYTGRMSNNQSNNPDVSNAPVYDSTEKKRVFKRVILFSLMFTIITLVGNYVSIRGSTGPYNVYVSFLISVISNASMMLSLLLIGFMIRWYKRGYYQNINKMVKDSPKAAIYSSILSAIIFVAIWLHGESAPIDVLILFPAIIFPIMLASSSLSTIMRYYMDIIGINKKMTNFNNAEQKDNLANSSFPCETMDGRRSVDVYSNEDMKRQLTFTEAPAVAEPLPTAVTNKNRTKDRTIRMTVIFLVMSFMTIIPVLGEHYVAGFVSAAYVMMPDFIRNIFIIYNLALSLIMIKMCIFRQYWATNKVLGLVSKIIILLICTIFTFVFAYVLYGYKIDSINNSDSIITVSKDSDKALAAFTTAMMTPTISINLYIIIFTIYFSWAILSYYKKSKSNIEKK